MNNKWPTQAQCNAFYGNPRGKDPSEPSPAWESANLVRIVPPYQLFYDGSPVGSIRVHRMCADAFMEAFKSIMRSTNGNPSLLRESGADLFGGAYNYRLMRGGNSLSMHSWGCAIDLDPARNSFRNRKPNFLKYPFVIKAFEDVGATWGGRWKGKSCDGMHFQFAKVG